MQELNDFINRLSLAETMIIHLDQDTWFQQNEATARTARASV